MNYNNINFIISAVSSRQYPELGLPEIAFVGRSNVGKSSLINKLMNRKSLARVSSKPGKTATINFYNLDDALFLVDLPGYGYAQVSKVEKERWGDMIEEYLYTRGQLRCIFLLVDSRHKPSSDDCKMFKWIKHYKKKVVVVATKWDKLKKSEQEDNLNLIIKTLNLLGKDIIISFSAVDGTGKEELLAIMEEQAKI